MQLSALKVDQGEIVRPLDFGKPHAGTLQPETAPIRIAQRQMSEVLVLMSIERKHPTADGQIQQFRANEIIDHISPHFSRRSPGDATRRRQSHTIGEQ
jgi:hypothetical protein